MSAASCPSTSRTSWRRSGSRRRRRSRTPAACWARPACEADMAAETEPLTFPASLEGWWYTDPEVFAAEQRTVYGRRWVCVARADEVAGGGDFLVREVGGESLIVLR